MNKKTVTYGSIAVVVIALAVIAFLVWKPGQSDALAALNSTASGAGSLPMTIKPNDNVHGKADAPVTIIEYASMTCPHCARFQKDIVPLITKDYIDTGKVKMVFREFPLDGAARLASAVARCLSGDNYFSFIDLLFANQDKWVQDFDGDKQLTKQDIVHGLTDMGRIAGMSADQVASCGDDPKNTAAVDDNWKEGQSLYHVDSTPFFIIQGTVHKGEISYDEMKKILDPLIPKKG